MNLRRFLRRLFKSRRVRPTTSPPPWFDPARTFDVYVCNEAQWRALPGWTPGRAGVRYGPEEGFGRSVVAFHHKSWPESIGPGTWSVRVVQAACTQNQRDLFLHELGGHELLAWGHDVQNTVMNADLRAAKGGTTDEDRDVLARAIDARLDAVRVRMEAP